jgi:hypothetical protein
MKNLLASSEEADVVITYLQLFNEHNSKSDFETTRIIFNYHYFGSFQSLTHRPAND